VEVVDSSEDDHEPGEYFLKGVTAIKWKRSNGLDTLMLLCQWYDPNDGDTYGDTWEPETNVPQEWREYVRKQKLFVDAPTYWKKNRKKKNEVILFQ
jgi:hypothetical protein